MPPLTNAEKVKRNYDKDREKILERKRGKYQADKLKRLEQQLQPQIFQHDIPIIEEEQPLPSTSEAIPLAVGLGVRGSQPHIIEQQLPSTSELIEANLLEDKIDALERVTQLISELPDESEGNKLFRTKNFKTIINIIKPTDYNELIFQLTKQPNKVLKLIKNYEYQPNKTYATNTLISLYKAILFFLDKFDIFIKPDKKIKYEDAIQIGDVVSSNELVKKNNSTPIPTFEEYLQKCIETFGNKSREFLIAKIYSEAKCRDDLQLILTNSFEDLNPQLNYLVFKINKSFIVINDYKTKDKYGAYRVELSDELSQLIKDFINTYDIEFGEKFFNIKNVSMVVHRMNKILNFTGHGAVNLFRKMVASDSKELPLKEQLNIAKQMKHSFKVHNSNYIVKESI